MERIYRPSAIAAVLFDADGVVVFPWRFARYLEQECAVTSEMTRGFFRGVFEECLVGKADLWDVLPPFLEQWGWQRSLADFTNTWFEIENAVDARLVSAIRRLRASGYICCLATSQERRRSEYMTTAMGFSEIFDRLFFSHALGVAKPDPAFFRLVTEQLNIKGEQLLFWDDDPLNVEAARRCGWNAEVYRSFADCRSTLAPFSVRQPRQAAPPEAPGPLTG
jgi:putative hydrolase of the HAD superfamily